MNPNKELKNGVQTFYAQSAKEWRRWLQKNGEKEKNVWLILYNKASGVPSLTYQEAVDEALCFGWIDSKPNKRDEQSRYQYFAQRKPKSGWSKINKDKVAQLIKEGRMHKTGLAAVERAKQTGTWTALDEVEALIVPPDLETALAKNKKAAEHFAAFPKSVKRGILEWISNAKMEETRKKRIAETVSLAKENIRANAYRPQNPVQAKTGVTSAKPRKNPA